MGGWSKTWFFFLVVTFLIYVAAKGDFPKWKALLQGKKPNVPGSVAPLPTVPTVPEINMTPFNQ